MDRNEAQPIISLVSAECSDQLMRRVLAFHLAHGWRVKLATTAPRAAVPEKFGLREAIDSTREDGSSELRSDCLVLEVVLEPTRALVRAGAHPRRLQIGMSSVECLFEEHPVEIWLLKESTAKGLASFRSIVEELQPSWAALMESTFRGPSLAEARSQDLPRPISLAKLFIADTLLASARDRGRLDELPGVPWKGGIFISGDEVAVSRACWPFLRKWAFAHMK